MTSENIPTPNTKNRRLSVFTCLLLAVATFAVYWQTLYFDFVFFDDQLFISSFFNLKEGLTLKNIIWAFTSTTLETNYWIPITWLSFLLDHELFGQNPSGFHLTNVLFHGVNTTLIYIVLKKMTRCQWQSAIVAALFSIHPLHVESVAWVTERKDVLSTFFFLLTLLSYRNYVKRPGVTRYLVTLLLFCLGLMSKPMLVTLPLLLMLVDIWPLDRYMIHGSPDNSKIPFKTLLLKLILEKIPFFILLLVIASITFIAQQKTGNVGSLESYPIGLRLSNAIVSYAAYIGKMIYPLNLAALYPYPEFIPWWKTGAAGLLLICVSWLSIKTFRNHPYIFVGWFWYLITLLPVIGLVKVGPQAMADRYTYIPLIGLFISLSWGFSRLASLRPYLQTAVILFATASLLLFSSLTWKQIGYWRDTVTLFEHTIAVTGKNPKVHYGLGVAFFKNAQYEKAISQFAKALELDPGYLLAMKNMGVVLEEQGKLASAVKYYERVIRLAPMHHETYNDMGVALKKMGKPTDAEVYFLKALELKPDNFKARNNFADLLVQQNRFQEAVIHYREAIRINPNSSDIYNELGLLYGKMGNYDEAIGSFLKALQLEPDSAAIHNNLAVTYANQGKIKLALSHFSKAVQLDPDNIEMKKNKKRAEMIIKKKPVRH
jgi:tetratricopeptide (TPR) repeat protein